MWLPQKSSEVERQAKVLPAKGGTKRAKKKLPGKMSGSKKSESEDLLVNQGYIILDETSTDDIWPPSPGAAPTRELLHGHTCDLDFDSSKSYFSSNIEVALATNCRCTWTQNIIEAARALAFWRQKLLWIASDGHLPFLYSSDGRPCLNLSVLR